MTSFKLLIISQYKGNILIVATSYEGYRYGRPETSYFALGLLPQPVYFEVNQWPVHFHSYPTWSLAFLHGLILYINNWTYGEIMDLRIRRPKPTQFKQ